MRILFHLNDLGPGDSARSAVEMAGAMVAAGHSVTLMAAPGLLGERARRLGIDLLPVANGYDHKLVSSVSLIARAVREQNIEIIHAFEWESITRAFLASQLCAAPVTMTGTVHSEVERQVLPRAVPLLMGSRAAAAKRRAAGYTRVGVLEPWVDTRENRPEFGVVLPEVRTALNIDRDGLLVTLVGAADTDTSVSETVTVLKTVDAIASVGTQVQLLMIGDGPWREQVDIMAQKINSRCGRKVVIVADDVPDRRAIYAVSDVIIGSGRSLLVGMAFGNPVVVAGTNGFFRPLNHATFDQFAWSGWHGAGAGTRLGKAELIAALEPLLDSARLREYRGVYSRDLAMGYGLDDALARQLQEYRDALDTRVGRLGRLLDACRVGFNLLLRRGMRWARAGRRVRTRRQTTSWPTSRFVYAREVMTTTSGEQ